MYFSEKSSRLGAGVGSVGQGRTVGQVLYVGVGQVGHVVGGGQVGAGRTVGQAFWVGIGQVGQVGHREGGGQVGVVGQGREVGQAGQVGCGVTVGHIGAGEKVFCVSVGQVGHEGTVGQLL